MKPLHITEADREKVLEQFTKFMANADAVNNGKVNFSMDLTTLMQPADAKEKIKATIYMTPMAYLKMRQLVTDCDKELAWHGTVERLDELTFIIKDILVYPQIVTGATVESDDDHYGNWITKLDDDTLNHLRFQGHSHVNFACTPSGVDTSNWNAWLNMLGDDDFYIFCINNKPNAAHWIIYDMPNNRMFEHGDINVKVILEDGVDLSTWSKTERETNLKARIYTWPAASTTAYSTPTAGLDINKVNAANKPEQTRMSDFMSMTPEERKAYWAARDAETAGDEFAYNDAYLSGKDKDKGKGKGRGHGKNKGKGRATVNCSK